MEAEYSDKSIDNFLQKKFGQSTKLSELPPAPDVTVYSSDIENAWPYYFNTKNGRDKIIEGNYEDDYYVWQAARYQQLRLFYRGRSLTIPGKSDGCLSMEKCLSTIRL